MNGSLQGHRTRRCAAARPGRAGCARHQRLRLDGRRGPRLRVGAVLQRARSARALQHARHAEGAVHRLPDRRAGALLGHGARAAARSSPTTAAGTTRSRGCGDAAALAARFGEGSYQELRNDFHRNARDNLLVELGKHGLGKRDVVANVNFFVARRASTTRARSPGAGNSRPGASVELRFEMDTLVVLSNTPHPLDPATRYAPPPRRARASATGRRAARRRSLPHCRAPRTAAASR